ncbi:hypothetical protein DdX_20171 [Ditylenchus destructor]|uniref:Uncharacterized protein n=1 Tax=Ditylenchus destructor TaxID=166010 RepID=A0AAD4MH25_9BILA|nr:hypothetical protein DdX_20171 [Ditylenchus destructor]
MRANEDEVQFAQDLLNIGDASANDESGKVDLAKMKLEKSSITKEKLSKEIFQDLIKSKKWEEVSKCAILSPYNVETEMHNAEVLKMLPAIESIIELVFLWLYLRSVDVAIGLATNTSENYNEIQYISTQGILIWSGRRQAAEPRVQSYGIYDYGNYVFERSSI